VLPKHNPRNYHYYGFLDRQLQPAFLSASKVCVHGKEKGSAVLCRSDVAMLYTHELTAPMRLPDGIKGRTICGLRRLLFMM